MNRIAARCSGPRVREDHIGALLADHDRGRVGVAGGTPQEIANLIVFAVSDAASYINGAELVADNAMDKS